LFVKKKDAGAQHSAVKFSVKFQQQSVTLNQPKTVLKFAKICTALAKWLAPKKLLRNGPQV